MKPLSIKTKMALTVSLLFVLIIVLLSWGALTYLERSLKETISQQQSSLVSSLAASIDDKLRLAHSALISTAHQLPPEALRDANKAQHFLDDRISLRSIFDHLVLLSRDGKLITESPFLAARRGVDLSAEGYFRQTVASGKPFISNPYLCSHDHRHPAVFLTAPVIDPQGETAAVVVGSFDLWGSNFLGALSETGYGDASYFYLTDKDRTIIVHPDRSKILTKLPVQRDNALYEKALAGFDGSGEAINPQGERVITSVRHLKTTGWILAANHPVAAAYAPLEKARRYFLQMAAAMTLAVLAITWLVMKRLTEPLTAFTNYVKALPQLFGRHHPLKVDTGGEIGILAQEFNRMVSAIETQQAQLQEEKEKFSLAFQAAPSALVIAALPDGRIMEVNEAFERTMGYRRDEVRGRTAQELNLLMHPQDRQLILRKLETGEKIRDLEFRFRNKTGEEVVGLYAAEMIEIGGERFLLSLVNDITARKKAEDDLSRSEERYRRLYNETPVMLHSIDQNGCLVSVSNYWLDALGYEKKEVLGRRTVDFLTEESQRYAEDVVLPAFFRAGYCRDVPYQFVKKNGDILNVLLSATAERDAEGKVVRSLAVMIDVTERQRAEREIEKLNADLAARAIELESAYGELETFSYSVSHDLRKPLTLISGYAQIIQETCGSELKEDCRGFLEEIIDGTVRMSDLIDALLKLSQAGSGELKREEVNLSGIAYDVASDLALAEPERRAIFRIGHDIRLSGDAKLLRIVLENLIGNAWKYSSGQEEAIIEFGLTESDGKSACYVRDNGTGFDMAHATQLFTPFQRLPGACQFKGHGIGLCTVARIIRRHGGRVWAEAAPGKGATFWFTL